MDKKNILIGNLFLMNTNFLIWNITILISYIARHKELDYVVVDPCFLTHAMRG